ncbi:alpha/beta hydrolase, partial [Candidatus Binatia bacterium]|nr:alpha/beta hydrolase [Candidatus Binatia bacterium]
GATAATTGHALADEARDVAAVVATIAEPVFLLGHSYGAHVALIAAAMLVERVRKLVLYEPAWPALLDAAALAPLEALARAGAWDAFAVNFFRDALQVPVAELDVVRGSELWPPIVADAPATLHDLRALARHAFRPEGFAALRVPTLLQIGTESPRGLYATDALAAVLPDVRVEALPGQAHEAMTTAPDLYAASVERFLLA